MPEMGGRTTTTCLAELRAVWESPTQSQQMVLKDALRLLAVWAVKAARGQRGGSDLTVRPSQGMNAPQTAAKENT
jgi:hypothetical protein